MPLKNVQRIDLSQLTADMVVKMGGRHPDGREVYLWVDIFTILGDFAVGSVFAKEREKLGSEALVQIPELCRHIARLPLKGVLEAGSVEEPQSFELDIFPQPGLGCARQPTEEELIAAQWESITVRFDELSLFDRAEVKD